MQKAISNVTASNKNIEKNQNAQEEQSTKVKHY